MIFEQRTRKVDRMIQEIRTQGWTPTTIRRAGEALARVAAGDELATELVRWFLDRCNVDIDDVVDVVNGWKPVSPTTPHLDDVYAILARDRAPTELVARLKTRYAEPEKVLIAFLDEVFPDQNADQDQDGRDVPDRSREVEGAHRVAFLCLLLLGTSESTEYVLRRLSHFDWSDTPLNGVGAEVSPSSGEAIRAATLRLWPTMPWGWRADVLGFLRAHDLHSEQMFAMLMEVEFQALSYADLVGYVEGLWNLYDRRAMPHIHKILGRALGDAELGNANARAIVDLIFERFDNTWLTDEQCRRMAVVLVSKRRVGAIKIAKRQSEGWIARGPVPLAVAEELYEDAVGRRDVRVNADPTRPPPTGEHVRWYTADGAWVLPTKEATVYRQTREPIVFHDRPAEIASGFVIAYGIDSEAGLQLFEAVLRKHGIDHASRPSWW